jgi:NADH-quinone oxidoreductase subunit L
MILGVALIGIRAHSLTLSEIQPQPLDMYGCMAMTFLMIGAISKAGSMPFHSWIPDAAVNAPLPFMAFLPASLEKLLGIYMLSRITLDLFKLTTGSCMSMILMIIGAVTIVFAVMMALVQKDYKRLLSYHAISQVGYMVLGIGTAVPAGIVGGLFHMINHAMYKSTLFLTGGAVEKQAGTTNLEKLGGLARKMPITCICFIVAAASISGVPPFNGFFSKELVYDAAMERSVIFYIAAIVGSFFTAASFLKLGHSAYFGPRHPEHDNVKEAPLSMLVPMIVIASLCVLFGVWNALPLKYLVQPSVAAHIEGHNYAGWPASILLVAITVLVLLGALATHLAAAKKSGGGVRATNYIHYAPVFRTIYDRAERRYFDPYDIGMSIANIMAQIGWFVDRVIDWLNEGLTTGLARVLSFCIRSAHTGEYSFYVLWSLTGAVAVIVFIVSVW